MHVEADYHFICNKVAKNEIQVWFISSKDQLANVLIKHFSHAAFAHLRSMLHVESLSLA